MSESNILQVLIKMDAISREFFTQHQFRYNPNDEKTLDNLEQLITKLYPEKNKIFSDNFIPFGYYLGQVITNNIPGACWDDVGEELKSLEDMTVSISLKSISASKLMLYPLRRAARFIGDRNDSIVSFYSLTKKIVQKTVDLSTAPLDITCEHENVSFKIRSINKEQQDENGDSHSKED